MSRLMRLLWFVIGVLLLTVARPIFVPAKEPAEPQSELKSLLDAACACRRAIAG